MSDRPKHKDRGKDKPKSQSRVPAPAVAPTEIVRDPKGRMDPHPTFPDEPYVGIPAWARGARIYDDEGYCMQCRLNRSWHQEFPCHRPLLLSRRKCDRVCIYRKYETGAWRICSSCDKHQQPPLDMEAYYPPPPSSSTSQAAGSSSQQGPAATNPETPPPSSSSSSKPSSSSSRKKKR